MFNKSRLLVFFNSAELPNSPIIRANSRVFNDDRLRKSFHGSALGFVVSRVCVGECGGG